MLTFRDRNTAPAASEIIQRRNSDSKGDDGDPFMLRVALQMLEEIGPDQRRGELGARGDGVVAERQGDVHVGILEGGDPREADPGGGDDFAGRIPEFAVHHQAVAGGDQVRRGRAAAEALDLVRRESGVGVQPL